MFSIQLENMKVTRISIDMEFLSFDVNALYHRHDPIFIMTMLHLHASNACILVTHISGDNHTGFNGFCQVSLTTTPALMLAYLLRGYPTTYKSRYQMPPPGQLYDFMTPHTAGDQSHVQMRLFASHCISCLLFYPVTSLFNLPCM